MQAGMGFDRAAGRDAAGPPDVHAVGRRDAAAGRPATSVVGAGKLGRHGTIVATALLTWTLLVTPAAARPGMRLLPAVALARKAGVPLAVFVVQHDVVVAEEWHSYTQPTQNWGPSWTPAQADRLRVKLMGPDTSLESSRKVHWASFPVWCFAYADDHWAIYESKRGSRKIWGILAVVSWYWADSLSVGFMMPDDSQGWKLLNGKLIELTHRLPTPAPWPPPRPRRSPKSDFPSLFN